MNLLKKIVDIFRRYKMCLNCPLDPEECGRTNKIIINGNCTKVDRNDEND